MTDTNTGFNEWLEQVKAMLDDGVELDLAEAREAYETALVGEPISPAEFAYMITEE